MTLEVVRGIVVFEVWAFGLGLLGIVGYQLATGRIALPGLLRTKHPELGEAEPDLAPLSPTRVQLLLLTLTAMFGYVAQLPSAEPGSLPDLPPALVALFGASASIYLGGKSVPLVRVLFPPTEPPPPRDTEPRE